VYPSRIKDAPNWIILGAYISLKLGRNWAP
jgi:hypothetical protein